MRANRRRRYRLLTSLRRAVGPDARIFSIRHADGAIVAGRPPISLLASHRSIPVEADKVARDGSRLPNYWEGYARRVQHGTRGYEAARQHPEWWAHIKQQGAWVVDW